MAVIVKTDESFTALAPASQQNIIRYAKQVNNCQQHVLCWYPSFQRLATWLTWIPRELLRSSGKQLNLGIMSDVTALELTSHIKCDENGNQQIRESHVDIRHCSLHLDISGEESAGYNGRWCSDFSANYRCDSQFVCVSPNPRVKIGWSHQSLQRTFAKISQSRRRISLFKVPTSNSHLRHYY